MLDIEKATDEEILTEVQGLRYLYGLKKVIRYHLDRTEALDTESVAEHVYGMSIIAEYFLPHEDPNHQWDHTKIRKMILFHDIDEIETGDIIGYLKNDEDRKAELEAAKRAIAKIPTDMQQEVASLMEEYDARVTPEARLTKAIDKMEPNFHLFCEEGKKIHHHNKTTRHQHSSIKDPYLVDFPSLRRFNAVMVNAMEANGHFAPPV